MPSYRFNPDYTLRALTHLVLAFAFWSALFSVRAHGQLHPDQHQESLPVPNFAPPNDFELTSTVTAESFSGVIEPSQTVEERLAAIEKELRKQKDDAAKKKAADAKRPSFQIGGQLQIDYLWVGQDAANRATVGDVNDVIDIRRARFVARGEAYEVVEYQIGFDF